MTAPEPLVAAPILRRVLDDLVRLGIDREALLLEAALPPVALSRMRIRAPWSAIEDLFEAAERLSGDGRVGFHLGSRYEVSAPTVPELLMFASGTLRDGFQRVSALSRVWGDAERWVGDRDGVTVRYTLSTPVRRAHVHLHEHGLAMPVRSVQAATGVRLRPLEVRFAHPRDEDPAEYAAWFGCEVRFGAGRTEVVLRREQLDAPLPTSNVVFARHFEQVATTELAGLPEVRTLSQRLRSVLREALAASTLAGCTLETSAEALRLRPRTLQRALAGERTSFLAELDAVRRAAAVEWLGAGVDIAEVSWRLGYAEPSVFHRAFKRWTGVTPDRFRREA